MTETAGSNSGADEAALDLKSTAGDAASPPRATPDGLELPYSAEADKRESIATYKEVTVEQLAAVRGLLGDERRSTEFDILINTALEGLRNGALTERELVPGVQEVWPGTGINAARVATAMGAAKQAGYAAPTPVRGEPGWALTKEGAADVAVSRAWAQNAFETTVGDVQEHLEAAGRDVGNDGARLWTTILQRVLMTGVCSSFAAYNGEVFPQDGLMLLPKRYDDRAMRKLIMELVPNAADAELMDGLMVDAINPVTVFGNELVTSITVGYMLHAFMGRRDRMANRAVIGSVEGDQAFLDTRVLLLLLGAPEQARPIERAIQAAIEAGMEVIALDHYLEELRELIRFVEYENYNFIQHELAAGWVSLEAVGAVIGDDVLRMWFDAVASGKYLDWASFRAAVLNLKDRLRELGVKVQAHGNRPEDRANDFENALATEVALNGWKPRQPAALTRDADTMALVHRIRHAPGSGAGIWPKAWMITFDARIWPGYRRLHPNEQFPVTLTPASWLSVVSSSLPPATVEQLARAASGLLAEETFITIAARFPVRAAVELAKTLGPGSGGSVLDLYVAQQSLDELLRRQPDFDQDGSALVTDIGNEVLRKRAERQNASVGQARERMRVRHERDEAEIRASRLQAQNEAAARREVEHRASGVSSQATEELARLRQLWIRRTVFAVCLVLFAFAFIALLYFRLWMAAFLVVVSAAVFAFFGLEWIRKPEQSWHRLLLAFLITLFGLVAQYIHLPWQ